MPRFASKKLLLEAMLDERRRLDEVVAGLNPGELEIPGVSGRGQWSVKDVLAHVTEWEQMLLGWYRAGLRGETVKVPAADLNWRQTPLLNQRIYEKHKDRPLKRILAESEASHRELLELTRSLSEPELLKPGRFPWLRTLALVSYLASATSSHYRWARTRVQRWRKARGSVSPSAPSRNAAGRTGKGGGSSPSSARSAPRSRGPRR